MCVNCRVQMRWIGQPSVRVGGYAGGTGFLLGDFNQLAEGLMPLSMWYCQQCGKVDFYYPGT